MHTLGVDFGIGLPVASLLMDCALSVGKRVVMRSAIANCVGSVVL